jgi:hypothetical protein
MNFLLYATVSEDLSQSVREMLVTKLSGITVELHQALSEFWLRLQGLKGDKIVLLLLPGSREDMLDLLAIRHLLRDVRSILVLPDLEEDTVGLAHRLNPRHMAYVNNDLSGLAAVIDDVLDSSGLKQSEWGKR